MSEETSEQEVDQGAQHREAVASNLEGTVRALPSAFRAATLQKLNETFCGACGFELRAYDLGGCPCRAVKASAS